MHESLKRIIEEGMAHLEDRNQSIEANAKAASMIVDEAKKNMAALAHFAEDLPTKMLERFSHLLTGELDLTQQGAYAMGSYSNARLDIRGSCATLYGVLGDKNQPDKGRYRAIVILQKVD
jgi:di/tripeptidase